MDAPAPCRTVLCPRRRTPAGLACVSDSYFSALLSPHSAPLLTTTGLRAPEAHTLDAVILAWFAGENGSGVRQAAARAYSRHQRIRGSPVPDCRDAQTPLIRIAGSPHRGQTFCPLYYKPLIFFEVFDA